MLLAACVSACGSRLAYSPPVVPPPAAAVVIDAPFDAVWAAVIQTLFQRNIPVKTLEKASGLLESEELHGEIGRDCDCGTWLGVPIAGYGAYGGDAYYRFRILVESKEATKASLLLRTSCRGQTERVEGALVCVLSAGKEAELRDAIVAAASGGRAATLQQAPH
jgi:hypothetical protein